MDSRQPVSTAVPCLSTTITVFYVKVNAQLASRRGPTPIKVWRKPGMRCPLVGKSDGIWGKAKLPFPADCFVCPIAMPTLALGSAQSMLNTGSLASKYMLVALESTMHVALFWSARLRSLWVQLAVNFLMSGKFYGGDVVPRLDYSYL